MLKNQKIMTMAREELQRREKVKASTHKERNSPRASGKQGNEGD